jgi:rhodanese-related sulfurtransferase
MNKNMIVLIIGAVIILVLVFALNNRGQNVTASNELSQVEISNLYYLRDEEKMAYDVYQVLGDKWSIQAFQNISNSEERHQSKVVGLMEKYTLEDKSKNLVVGKFSDQEIRKIYETLVAEGSKSLLSAFYVGATIEILDISDLDRMLTQTQKSDLIQVFQKLKMGSENHLSAFKKQISRFETFDESKLIKIENNNMQSNKINLENSLLVDVRTREEFASGNFAGSVNIPLDEVRNSLDIFKNSEKENIVLVCRSGARAGQAESILKSSGVSKNIVNLGPWQNLKDLK